MFDYLIFWFSLSFIIYSYFGYPFLILALSLLLPKKVNKARNKPEPMVSVVIAARNEERYIKRKIENLFQQDYPAKKLEIIVVLNNSNDCTRNILKNLVIYNAPILNKIPIKIIEIKESQGKAHALNIGVEAASGEIIVFADARQIFSCSAIRELCDNFQDISVGCVSGELFFHNVSEDDKVQIRKYWDYEKWIRKTESLSGSVVGATGAIYAVRRSLYCLLPVGTILDDVLTPMNVALQGYRVIYDKTAVAWDEISKNIQHEWVRKVRTLAGNWQLLEIKPELMSFRRNPIWWRFMSHKIARLIVPFCLIITLLSNFLIEGYFYRIFFYTQIALYLIAAIVGLSKSGQVNYFLKVPYFFCIMNGAALIAFFKFLFGDMKNIWKQVR